MNNKILSLVLVFAILLASCTIQQLPADSKRHVDVSGQAQVSISPDQVEVYAQVQTVGQTAAEAQQLQAERMVQVRKALLNAGLTEKDYETSGFTLYPERVYDEQSRDYVVKGYRASHNTKITIKDVASAGSIVDQIVNAGVNEVQSIQFTLSRDAQEKAVIEAREKAMKKARDIAERLAKTAGARLGDVLTLSATDYVNSPRPVYYGEYLMKSESSASTSYTPGDVDVSASVSVAYELQ